MDVFVFDCVYECRPPAKMNLGQVIPGSKLEGQQSLRFKFSSSYVETSQSSESGSGASSSRLNMGHIVGKLIRKWQACLKVRQQLRSAAVSIVGLFQDKYRHAIYKMKINTGQT